METSGRRTTDATLSDIEKMILEENDPERRCMLIVLNAIAVNLHANTVLTQNLASKVEDHMVGFTAHVAAEEAMLNRGRGAWKVFAWVMTAAQALIVTTWVSAKSELVDIHATLQAAQITSAQVELRLKRLETKE